MATESDDVAVDIFRELVAHLDAVLWLTTPDKREMTYVSPAFDRVFGVPREELRKNPSLLLELTHPDDREKLRIAMASQREGAWERRYRIVRPGGEVRWIRARAFPVRNAAGAVYRIAGISEDVTAIVATEDALAHSRHRFESLAEHSGAGIWQIDTAGQTVYINPAMCAQLEVDGQKDLSGISFHRFFTAESLETMRREHAKRAAGTPSSYTVDIVGMRGARRRVLVNGAPLFTADGRIDGLIGTFSDVTEHDRLEVTLRQAQKMEGIGQLAAGVAHDFNNLLVPIIGYTDLMLSLDPRPDTVDDLRAIGEAALQAKELIAQLLAFGRKQALSMGSLSLNAEIRGFGKVLRRMLRENIALDLQLADDDRLVRADSTQMRQVLMNLVSNAQDAMPDGGTIRIGTRAIELGATSTNDPASAALPAGRYVELCVSDTGAGMDDETKARIFEPFFSTKAPGRGTGLGLATVYGVIRQHGGEIRCASAEGRGTSFTIWLPAADGVRTPTPDALPLVSAGEAADVVLLVEDQEPVRRLVARVLDTNGFRVLEATDGIEALERARAHDGPIGLLITDVVMPRMGGQELSAALRALHPALRVLYVSGYPSDTNAPGVHQAGTAFLAKPFTAAALLRHVHETLQRGS